MLNECIQPLRLVWFTLRKHNEMIVLIYGPQKESLSLSYNLHICILSLNFTVKNYQRIFVSVPFCISDKRGARFIPVSPQSYPGVTWVQLEQCSSGPHLIGTVSSLGYLSLG